jgi:truncated hemoglobin YjbI
MTLYREIPIDLEAFRGIYHSALQGDPAKVHLILEDFYQRMAKDVLLDFFFTGKDLKAIAARQAEFVLRAMGAAPSYSGRPPAQAHLSMPPILSGHFDRRLKLLEETLRAHGLPEDAIQAWLGFENTFREAIISR